MGNTAFIWRLVRLMACLSFVFGLPFLAGCAAEQTEKFPRLTWPPPPDTTRIEFLRDISSDKDLYAATSVTQSVVDFVAGSTPLPNHIIEPMGIAVSDDGNTLYVSDTALQQVLIFNFAQKTFSTFDGFAHPLGLALDGQQNLYVVDQVKRGVSVRDPSGKEIRFITDKSLIRPTGIALDRTRGKFYVVDTANVKVDEHNVKVFSLDGALLGHVGSGYGPQEGGLMYATYCALDAEGNLYVGDTVNNRVEVFDPNGKYLRTVGSGGDTPGHFGRAKGVAIDTLGDLYVVDSAWSNVQIFNRNGQPLMFFADRGPMPGLLRNPTAIAIDKNNHIYVGDLIDHRVEEYQLVNTVLADTLGGPLTTAVSN